MIASSAALGALGVAIGAFGAHVIPQIAPAERVGTFATGAEYHMYHALAMLLTAVLYGREPARLYRIGWFLFGAGILLFSGSLYLLVLTDTPRLAMITPFGGLSFIAGWICLAWGALQKRRK